VSDTTELSDDVAPARENPFVGPRALRYGETIYGRSREIHELCSLVVAQRIVLLYAPSGAGKTSLVGAGLQPELERRQFQVFPAIRVGFDPPDPIDARNRYVLSALTSVEEGRPIADRIPRSELATMTFDQYIDRVLEGGPPDLEPCFLFDQFEELVTLDPSDADAKGTFLHEVGVALRDRGRWALFSMREDFIAQLDPYLGLIPNRLTTRYRLDLLAAAAAVGTVQNTAENAGVQFTDEAADALIDDLRRVRVQRGSRTSEELGPTVEPVQLQVVCRQLWSTIASSATTIGVDDVAALGRVDDALADFYVHQVHEVSERTGATVREIRTWFDEELISESGFRAQVLDGPGVHGADVLRELENAHLIRAERRRGTEWYELVHDRMIDPIRVSNAAWREHILSPLQRDAQVWDRRGRPPGLVLTGATLEDAEHWATEHRGELNAVDEDFLSASRNERQRVEKERRVARRRVIVAVTVSAALAILAGVAVLLAVAADRQRNLAERATAEATRERRTAVARQLASSSLEAGAAARSRSVLLAIEAVRATAQDGVRIPAAEQALRAALADPLSTKLGTVQPGDAHAMRAVAFSPDGSVLASGSADGSITLWDPAKPDAAPRVLARSSNGITALGFSRDGRWLATGEQDGVVRVWDTTDLGRPPREPGDHQRAGITALAFNADGTLLATASLDNTARVWRLDDGDEMSSVSLHDHDGFVLSLAFDPGGTHLVTGGGDGLALLYDVADLDADPVPVFRGSDDITSVAFSPDGRWLAIGDTGESATLWDMTAGQPANPVVLKHLGAVRTLVFSPDGRWLATGSDDATAELWDLADPTNAAAHPVVLPQTDVVTVVRFSASGRWLATGSRDDLVRLYDVADPSPYPVALSGHEGAVTTMAFDGAERLATGSVDGTARLWDLDHLDRQPRPLGSEDRDGDTGVKAASLSALAVSPDGRRVATGDTDKVVRVWDVNAPDAAPIDLPHAAVAGFGKAGIDAVAFTPDGRRLVTGGGDRIVRIWDLDAPAKAPVTLPPLGAAVTSLAVDPDGRWLAVGAKDKTALVWDLSHITVGPRRLRAHYDEVTAVAFSPDGAWLVTGSRDRRVRRWPVVDLAADPEVWQVPEPVTSIAISPDSARIAAGGSDRTVLVWDVQDGAGTPPLTLVAGARVRSLAFGGGEPPSGNLLVVAGDKLQSWDLDAPDRESSSVNPALLDDVSPATLVASSPADQGFASGSTDGVARTWLPLAALDDLGCRAAGRNLTRQEWDTFLPGQRYRPTCEQWPSGS
jgi:WD40 repeat protein